MICGDHLSLICWVRVQTLPLSLRWQDMRTSKQRRAMTNAPKKQSGKPPSYCTCLIKRNDNEKNYCRTVSDDLARTRKISRNSARSRTEPSKHRAIPTVGR